MATPHKVLVLHGPNLNLLGQREPEIYGSLTLAQIDQQLQQQAIAFGVELTAFQSNSEGELVTAIQKPWGNIRALSLTPPPIPTPVLPFGMP